VRRRFQCSGYAYWVHREDGTFDKVKVFDLWEASGYDRGLRGATTRQVEASGTPRSLA
jgi:hypothetical protein